MSGRHRQVILRPRTPADKYLYPYQFRQGLVDVRLEIEMSEEQPYTCGSIKILEGTEAVRKRPAMYIGSTDQRGVTQLLWEVVDNCVDEHLSGFATRLDISRGMDGSWCVGDDGRGLSVDKHPDIVEVVFSALHCGRAGLQRPGVHGVGIAPVCALSSWMRVEIHRAGKIWQQLFVQGKPAGELTVVGQCTDTGTTVQFLPDLGIFNCEPPTLADVRPRIRELAALCPGLHVTLQGEDLTAPRGLVTLALDRSGPGATLEVSGELHDIQVQIAIAWGAHGGSSRVFANQVEVELSGPVLEEALVSTRATGRHAVASLILEEPCYEGQRRDRLANVEALLAIQQLLSDALPAFLANHPELASPEV